MPAPNIQYQQLPAEQQQSNPRQYFTAGLERDKASVKQYYSTQWKMLRKTSGDEKQFRQNVIKLQAKTDVQMQEIEYGYKQKAAQLDQIMQLTNQGLISSETGQRAAWQTAGFNIPKDQEPDWRLEHGRTVQEINRVQAALNSTDARTGKATFPKKDVKFGFGKQLEYDWDKLSPERTEQLGLLLNAKDFLLQQEKSTYERLPQMQKKATALQSAGFARERNRKWAQSKFTHISRAGPPPKWFMQGYDNKPVGLSEKVIADMPKPQQTKTSSRQELLTEYKRLGGSKTSQGQQFANQYLR